jgi:mono/diheme cytochrome c family protein
MSAALAVGIGYADQSNSKLVIPVSKTPATSGKQMYVNYCAPCHGVDGKGRGPVSTALTTPPTDLTVLARNHRGKFPDTHIVSVLEYGSEIKAHGTNEMPVWGPILGKMNQANSQDRMLRISNLSRYMETIQVK